MRTLLALALVTASATCASALEPRMPTLSKASVTAAPGIPRFLAIAEPHQVRGVDVLLLPIDRLLWIEDRTVPKGTREERVLTLVFDLGQPTALVFDDGTATTPAQVLAALSAAR